MISLQNINDKINLRGMLSQFQDILIDRFIKSIKKKKVGNSKYAKGRLVASFKKAMFYSGNDIQRASVSFLAFGRMVDGGWGKGSSATDRQYIRSTTRQTGEKQTRKRKAWYSKTKTGQIIKFRELMVKQYGAELVHEAEQQLTQTMTLNNIL